MAVKGLHSLSFTPHKMKSGSHVLKHPGMNISKQNFQEHKMFGSKRKNIQIGKKFKGSGKGIMKGSKSAHMMGNMKSSGISPSLEEFDKMMSSITKGNSKSGSKKSMFRSKQE